MIKIFFKQFSKVINKNLTPHQMWLLFNNGCERPYTGEFLEMKTVGEYCCANCDTSIFL